MTNDFDVLIIGAGAAGLMAATSAAKQGARVALLDSQTKIGAKILVSGGGRCNVTNVHVDASRFHTSHAGKGGQSFVGRVLRGFSVEATHRFFQERGVELKLEETGKYFPVSNSSRTVLNALIEGVQDAGAQLKTNQCVQEVCPQAGAWIVRTPEETFQAKAVVLCTGGLALPKSGSNGAGYNFATRLGHTLVKTTPALTPLLAHQSPHAEMSGVTLPVRLMLRHKNQTLAHYDGSFLFTHTGYSGPVSLNISRHVARERWTRPDASVHLRLLPQVADGQEGAWWQEFVKRNAKKSTTNALTELLPRRVAESVGKQSGAPTLPLGRLATSQQMKLREALLHAPLPVSQVADYVKAEATAGGISLEEIDAATMSSRLHPGFYFAGEVCDVDGWLGGYNFQWAWSSGVVAGRGAARYALSQHS